MRRDMLGSAGGSNEVVEKKPLATGGGGTMIEQKVRSAPRPVFMRSSPFFLRACTSSC